MSLFDIETKNNKKKRPKRISQKHRKSVIKAQAGNRNSALTKNTKGPILMVGPIKFMTARGSSKAFATRQRERQ